MRIVIDTAQPIDGPTVVAAARAVGADGVAGYLRGWPQWTAEVARYVLDAGLGFLPIELYFGQAPADTLRLLAAWGLPLGPVAMDVETGSWPSEAWQLAWQRGVDGAGYESVGYSQAAPSVPWRRRWGARYTWPGQPDQTTLEPVQAIPAGWDAAQYAHDLVVGQLVVDVSNFGFALGGEMDQTTFNDLMDGYFATVGIPPGQTSAAGALMGILPAVQQTFNAAGAVKAELDALKAEVDAGQTVDVPTALARIEAALQGAGKALGGA